MKNFNLRLSRKSEKSKYIAALVALCLVAAFGVGGVLAYIFTNTDPIENKFDPGKVDSEVVETFDGEKKEDVTIKNTGNTVAYIRAYINITFKAVGAADDQTVSSQKPIDNQNYTIKLKENSGWSLGDDGYYYYSEPVSAGCSTKVLIEKCELLDGANVPDGFYLSVEIVASAIQAEPTSVVAEKWNVTLTDGKIYPKNQSEVAG